MDMLYIPLPENYSVVAERLCRADWLVHNFYEMEDPKDCYNPANYIYSIEFHNTEYHALLDLNILQYVVNCIKKDTMHDQYRDACAMLAFCQLSDIQIEPGPAIYERINYNHENLNEALDELALFRALDNADVEQLIQYALGDRRALQGIVPAKIDRKAIGQKLTNFRRLTNWDSIYLLVLMAVSTYWNNRIPKTKKLDYYLDWMIREFRLSLPCIVYAVRLFGHNPLPKMMKYRINENEHYKRTAVFNMTWDLFHIDSFFKNWVDPKQGREEVFFTQDRMLSSLLRLAISVQYNENISPLLCHLNPPQAKMCQGLLYNCEGREDRMYNSDSWSPNYREECIQRLEKELY